MSRESIHRKSPIASPFVISFCTNYFQTREQKTCFSFFIKFPLLYWCYIVILAAKLIFTLQNTLFFRNLLKQVLSVYFSLLLLHWRTNCQSSFQWNPDTKKICFICAAQMELFKSKFLLWCLKKLKVLVPQIKMS
jgi:hypothetical protein